MATSTASGHQVVNRFVATASPAEIAACSLAIMRGNGIRLPGTSPGHTERGSESVWIFTVIQVVQEFLGSGTVCLIKLLHEMNRHPEGPLNERAQSGSRLRAALARKWAERASRTEGPCAFYYMEFYVTKNARSLKATRPLICPFTPKAGANGDPKTRSSLTPFKTSLGK